MIVRNLCSRSNEMRAHHRAKSPLTISEMCSKLLAALWWRMQRSTFSLLPRSAREPPPRCNAITGLLRGLIEDIDASAQCDTPWRELMDKGVRQVDLPALLHQRTQRIYDSVAFVKRATLTRRMQDAAEFLMPLKARRKAEHQCTPAT